MADQLPPVDLDLRLVRYFTVVADHRHFGRAAATLHVAQPSLSRQIRSLEQQLGARLLDRTPQGSQLTEAGDRTVVQAREAAKDIGRIGRPDICDSSKAPGLNLKRGPRGPSGVMIGETLSFTSAW